MQQTTLNEAPFSGELPLITPESLKQAYPLPIEQHCKIQAARRAVADIIHRRDHRLLVVCGPCSIHDPAAALDYAARLSVLADQLRDHLLIVMRVYFEKPRTTTGWKGLINDPDMDGSYDIEKGLRLARQLLIRLAALRLPLATETLDPGSPPYLSDLFSWSAIGARTTESQTHRELASGLGMPVGFKNGTDGNLSTAINALQAAARPHRYIGIGQNGRACLIQTAGNPDGHVILRGGHTPNYHAEAVAECERTMTAAGLTPTLMIDCSHGNSAKDFRRQPQVAESVVAQIEAGNRSIIGLMLESHLQEGNQPATLPAAQRRYGVSVTDGCLGWAETERLLRSVHQRLAHCLPGRVC